MYFDNRTYRSIVVAFLRCRSVLSLRLFHERLSLYYFVCREVNSNSVILIASIQIFKRSFYFDWSEKSISFLTFSYSLIHQKYI